MKHLGLLAAVVVLVVAGCDSVNRVEEVSLRTDDDVYAPGDEIRVRLENQTGTTIAFSLCHDYMELQRRSGSSWLDVDVSLGGAAPTDCSPDLTEMLPGQQAVGMLHLPDTLALTTYRLATSVRFSGNSLGVSSRPFDVTQ